MVAVWPGMGNVAINAGVYLLANLEMTEFREFESEGLYDVDAVIVKNGLIQAPRRPRNRFFLWKDPREHHDLIVFLGEAQPPLGKFSMCQRLTTIAAEYNVERIFTFAAMATRMHPTHHSRVFGASTDAPGVAELRRLELEVLEDGQISGLNGVLLGAAQEVGLRGTCLLGEMPHIFHQVPFPQASLVILEAFSTLADIEIDLAALEEQARVVDQQLGTFLARIERRMAQEPAPASEAETFQPESEPDEIVSSTEKVQIERLFDKALQDRSAAFELKQLLDRLGVFKEYEDRFLDLFKKPEP